MSVTVDGVGVTFRLADRPRRLAEVRLIHELGPAPVPFDRVAGEWLLRLDQPVVDRMEYLLELTDHNDRRTTITDPDNPLAAPGAFGAKSVIEFSTYHAPEWLGAPQCPHEIAAAQVGDVEVTLWAPSELAADEAAPLVLVHDGPEYDRLGSFTTYLATQVAAGALPPLRAALLDPGDRNAWYAANRTYAAELVDDVLPALPPASAVIGVGVSLGALAMLHAHRVRPGTFAALLLQSGSFFTPQLDPQERGFPAFAAVSGFVASVHDAATDAAPVPVALTCGIVEENLENNRAMTATLARLDYRAALTEVADAHNYTAWRDALHPHLTGLVEAVTAHAP